AADTKLQQQFAERFLDKLIRDKDLLVEDARQQALADLPELTGLSAEEIQGIIDGRISELAEDEAATPLERARAKLTKADYDGVLEEAAAKRSQTRELEMLAGLAALAKFHYDPQPQWNQKAAAAFLRAVALSDADTHPLQWADAAVFAAVVLKHLTRFEGCEDLLRRAWKLREAELGPDDTTVALVLSNLLMDTNRLAEAEPLIRRALAIDERSYGAEHPNVATHFSILAVLLQTTNRLAEAEPLIRRALAIDEQSYGAEHPKVATRLNNLAGLLKATNRLAEAEPLCRRQLEIFVLFGKVSGHEHMNFRGAQHNYVVILKAMELSEDEIGQRVQAVHAVASPLEPIQQEVDRLLGTAKPVAEVLAALDRQNKEEEKPELYFLPPSEPIAPHLNDLLKADSGKLAREASVAYLNGNYAAAVVLGRESSKQDFDLNHSPVDGYKNRSIVGVALRELGALTKSQQTLQRLLSELPHGDQTLIVVRGFSQFQLALCEWQLGNKDSAVNAATASLESFEEASDEAGIPDALVQQMPQLLAALKGGSQPPPVPEVDVEAELSKALARFHAREKLATLPFDQPVAPLLDQMLGPGKSTQKVLADLEARYREQGKPEIYFLPLDQAMTPHLDQLLGPAKSTDEVLAALDAQYREQGKPDVWFLPLDESISPHLDELLGPVDSD
ncbi:MAG: tetratricopeptide repeat protein, partial [Planctomycetota bacterium]|nr:tetratricopeptide repeat protein [Planctomycetota bacterium]